VHRDSMKMRGLMLSSICGAVQALPQLELRRIYNYVLPAFAISWGLVVSSEPHPKLNDLRKRSCRFRTFPTSVGSAI